MPPMAKRPCPSCTAPMSPFHAGKTELDRCPFCHGLWFDGGELETVLGKRMVGELDNSTVSARKCAQDSTPMQPAVLGGLRVEVCLKCRGVFLDDGELTALNGGERVRVKVEPNAPKPAARAEAKVQDDVMNWLHSLGA